jgi:hypothetical protein
MGFLVVASITVGSLIQIFLSDSLPDTYLTDLDRSIIALYQSSRPWPIIKGPITAFLKFFRWTRLGISRKQLKQWSVTMDKRKRVDLWFQFVISLSNQQLCVGLAILIAATANLCELSIYELRVINALSFFASTIHLVSLHILKQYLYEHRIVREIRVVAMVINLGLLFFNQFIVALISDEDDYRVPLGAYYLVGK